MNKISRLNEFKPVEECCPQGSCCGGGVTRRGFLAALSGGVAAAVMLADRPVMAGPFETADFAKLIPPDKKLNPQWVASLYARGEPTVYSKAKGELQFIGMPVGGLCCGTVYLGGDGKLWLWDIFNQNSNGIEPRNVPWSGFGHPHDVNPLSGANYVQPAKQESPFEQGFVLRVNSVDYPMDARGWKDITFRGNYPIGEINYRDPACPVAVKLQAYSPFIPLNTDDSSLPATLCEFTITNISQSRAKIQMAGFLQNACSLFTAGAGSGARVNEIAGIAGATVLSCRFDIGSPQSTTPARPDIVVDTFNHPTYGKWKVTGTAFGNGPILRADIPAYQGNVGGKGPRVVNSHASAPGTTIAQKDAATGTLTSPSFTIERRYLNFYLGGGSDIQQVGLQLSVDGKVVRRATGDDSNHMRRVSFDVSEFMGKKAVIEIYDHATGSWGNIGVSDIVQSDTGWTKSARVSELDTDYGTMALAVLGKATAHADLKKQSLFDAPISDKSVEDAENDLTGALVQTVALKPGESQTVTFIIAWHFPNCGNLPVAQAATGNYYSRRFGDAKDVAEYAAVNYARLSRDTKRWRDTWYDSSLPYWFLDRTVYNTACLATSTSHRFATGLYWGWEGVGCCPGTCTHVYEFAQATSRLFPDLERDLRRRVDFGMALNKQTGMIGYRGPGTGPATDGQAGMILCALREHLMSADNEFLQEIWPGVRRAIDWLMNHSDPKTGLITGPQPNTLDAAWYGEIAWISGLYAAALKAGRHMATTIGDAAYASRCERQFNKCRRSIETRLFNGRYFIQRKDPRHPDALGTYDASFIEQVHGQSWAWQLGMGRVLDRAKTLKALKSLYKYNFTLNVGPFRSANPPGRPYALAGEGGLIMATNPQGIKNAFGNVSAWQYGYFDECMSGFEHQVAGHMLAEGLLLEGLAVTRAIEDRYSAKLRNPFNEIECSDHYSRSMASYGSFIAICGYEYDGPRGHIAFAPRLQPHRFKAAFTSAQGWGSISLRRTKDQMRAEIGVAWGKLRLRSIGLPDGKFKVLSLKVGRNSRSAAITSADQKLLITLHQDIELGAGEKLSIVLTSGNG